MALNSVLCFIGFFCHQACLSFLYVWSEHMKIPPPSNQMPFEMVTILLFMYTILLFTYTILLFMFTIFLFTYTNLLFMFTILLFTYTILLFMFTIPGNRFYIWSQCSMILVLIKRRNLTERDGVGDIVILILILILILLLILFLIVFFYCYCFCD